MKNTNLPSKHKTDPTGYDQYLTTKIESSNVGLIYTPYIPLLETKPITISKDDISKRKFFLRPSKFNDIFNIEEQQDNTQTPK